MWDLASRAMVQRYLRPDSCITAPGFDDAGYLFVSLSDRGIVDAWDRSLVPDEVDVLRHGSYVYAVAFSPDGQRFVTGGWDKVIRIWNSTSRALLQTIECDEFVTALAVSPDGHYVVK